MKIENTRVVYYEKSFDEFPLGCRFMIAFSMVRLRPVVQAAAFSLIAGWLVALLFGLIFAKFQYDAVANVLPPSQIQEAVTQRLERELGSGPLLIFVQLGVTAGVLAWRVNLSVTRSDSPKMQGSVTGAVVALVQTGIALMLHIPTMFIVPMILILIAVGTGSAFY